MQNLTDSGVTKKLRHDSFTVLVLLPRVFGRGSDRRYRPHGLGAYGLNCLMG